MACTTYYGTFTNYQTLYGTTSVAATLYGTSYYTSVRYVTSTSVSGGYTQRRQKRQFEDHDGKLPTATAYIAPTSQPRRNDLLGVDIGNNVFIAPAQPMPTAAPVVVQRDLSGLVERDLEKRDIYYCTNAAYPYIFIYCGVVCEAYATYTCTNAAYPYISSCDFNTAGGCAANAALAGWSYGGMVGNYAYGQALSVTITSTTISSSLVPTLTTFSSSTFPTATSTIVTSSATSTFCPGVNSPTTVPATTPTTTPPTTTTPRTTVTTPTPPGVSTVNGAGVSVVASGASTTTPVPVSTGSSHSGLSTGAKAGIGVGAALGALAVLAIIGFFIAKDRKKKDEYSTTTDPYANGGSNGYSGQNGQYNGQPEFSGHPELSGADTGAAASSYSGHQAAFGNGALGHGGGGFAVDPAMAGIGAGATLGAYGAGQHYQQQQQQQHYADPYANQHARGMSSDGGSYSPAAAGTPVGSSAHRQSIMSGLSNEPRSGAISPTIATENSGNYQSTGDSSQPRNSGHDRLWED
ncbi:hypothetical protein T439DRAFT_378068 [Meredithblackwellia eburnea MCA 4105]